MDQLSGAMLVFSRFTEDARNVVVATRKEAYAMKNASISPEHLVTRAPGTGPVGRGRHDGHTGSGHVLLALLEYENGDGVLVGSGVDRTDTEGFVTAELARESAAHEHSAEERA